jgi:hypothetical protein
MNKNIEEIFPKSANTIKTFQGKNELIPIQGLILHSNVESIENRSDDFMKRARIRFKNGIFISVVFGKLHDITLSYGANENLFEIAIADDDKWRPDLFDEEDKGDQVLGHVDIVKLNHYIQKIGSI